MKAKKLSIKFTYNKALFLIWLLIFIVGEVAALVWSVTKGTVFQRTPRTNSRALITKTVTTVFLSTIVRDCVNQFDKVILKQAINVDVVMKIEQDALKEKLMKMMEDYKKSVHHQDNHRHVYYDQ